MVASELATGTLDPITPMTPEDVTRSGIDAHTAAKRTGRACEGFGEGLSSLVATVITGSVGLWAGC